MGKHEKRRMRRETQDAAKAEMAGYKLVLERCGEGWSGAYTELREADVPFSEFASEKFDCRECPMYAHCLTTNHFDNSKWRFPWYEAEYAKYQAPEERTP